MDTVQINPDIFREFSIRGIADQDLTDEVVVLIGQAIGAFFKNQDNQSLVIGRDVRLSSERISQSLIKGLLAGGIKVTEIGTVPTPVHNFATDYYGADGGVQVTASHNPAEYNGLKIRSADRTLYGHEIQEIYRLAVERQDVLLNDTGQGELTRLDPLPVYLGYLKALVHFSASASIRPLKVVADGGHGTNGQIVSDLLRELGCNVIELYSKPDGNFPEREPDPTASGATDALAAVVQKEGADLGLAYDGDGDRLVLVDENGSRVMGDQIMMILAREILHQGSAKIVYEILCTQALADDVLAHGGQPVMTPSGYAFVHEAMQKTGAALGGELSGHLFFNESDFHFDDAILATVKILNVVAHNKRPMSELVAELPTLHSSDEIRLDCPDEIKTRVVERVQAQFAGDYKVETVDGARIHFGDGWALVRQSNTQPKISMRFEARSAVQLKLIQSTVQSFVEATIRRYTAQ